MRFPPLLPILLSPQEPSLPPCHGDGDFFAQFVSVSGVCCPAEPTAPSSSSHHPKSSPCSRGCCQCQRPLRPGPSSCTTGRRWNLISSKTEMSPRVSAENQSWKERSFHLLGSAGQAGAAWPEPCGGCPLHPAQAGRSSWTPPGKGKCGNTFSNVLWGCSLLFSSLLFFPLHISPRCLILRY